MFSLLYKRFSHSILAFEYELELFILFPVTKYDFQ